MDVQYISLTTTENAAQVLREARALIARPEDWCKRYFEDDGRRCALAAVHAASDYGWLLVRSYLHAALPSGSTSVVVWQDHPDTTHADVMALFGRAIALAEAVRS